MSLDKLNILQLCVAHEPITEQCTLMSVGHKPPPPTKVPSGLPG